LPNVGPLCVLIPWRNLIRGRRYNVRDSELGRLKKESSSEDAAGDGGDGDHVAGDQGVRGSYFEHDHGDFRWGKIWHRRDAGVKRQPVQAVHI
jgi:hypothetical protein